MAKVYLTDNDRRSDQMRALLAKYQTLRNTKTTDLALRLGISRPTLNRKKRNADSFTLGEVRAIAQSMKIPLAELLDALDLLPRGVQ